jgi:putative ABC transport system permease protein
VSFPQQPTLYPGDAYQGRIHMSFVVRTTAHSAQIVDLVRARLAEIDAAQPVYGVRSVEQVVAQAVAPWRLYVSLLGSFAILAVTLAALGIHAVIAGSVAERRHEIGIRMALGARRGDVLALVFRHAMGLVGVGLMVGLAGAQIATHSIHGWLYGISMYDPVTYVLVCAGVLLLTGIAVIRPARQAVAVDPIVALRSE